MKRKFKRVTFKPWEGDCYDNSPLGLRLLILGESHYRTRDDRFSEASITIRSIKGGRHSHRYWLRLSALVSNSQPPHQADIWDSVMFYNYVQHIVGEKPRESPKDHMWTSNQTLEGFREVLRIADPERILVVGKRNWKMMAGGTQYFPERPPIKEQRFQLPSMSQHSLHSVDGTAYWYPTSKGNYALCAPIFHPAYPRGFYSEQTKEIVRSLLRKTWKAPTP